jgi:signal transduction histidine kinase
MPILSSGNDKDVSELAIREEELKTKTGFPLFIKLLIVFLLFIILPFAAISLVFISKHDGALKSLVVLFGYGLPPEALAWIQAAIHNFRIQAGFLIVVFLMTAIAGIVFSAHIVVKPLAKLINGVRRLTQGEYGTKIELTSQDEFSIFAQYFNEMSQRLKLVIERERAASRVKSEFVSLAAHQLRTPLSAAKWSMKMLLDGDLGALTQAQAEFLNKGYEANERMIRLVNDLLDVAKIEEGKFGYDFSYDDIAEVIKSTIGDQDILAQKRDIKIIFREPTRHFPKIKMDVRKIKLALENILENAINYTLPGGSVEINIAPRGDEYLEVSIKDTGVGIPKHQLDRVFSKFFRGENVVLMQTDGSGLGLFIVKNIIKRHGGDVWIESEEGKGTAVHFTLPLAEKLIPLREEAFSEFIMGF